MNAARLPIIAVALGALAAPWTCIAATRTSVAAHNCAEALASRLDARLAGVNVQRTIEFPISTSGWVSDQMIVTARSAAGINSGPMVCRYDNHGRVISLHRPAPVDDMPLIDGSTSAF